MTYLPEKGPLPLRAPFDAIGQADLGRATLRQMEKDFGLQGLDLQLPEEVPEYGELLTLVADYLRNREVLHGPAFGPLLYQLDLDETKMRHLIASAPPAEMHLHIAHEMLCRAFAKVVFRRNYKP